MTRREFPEAVKAEIRARSGGRCECYRMPADIRHMFPKECDRPASDVDHIYADTLETEKAGALTADDGAHLSKPCHKIKTASDQRMRAKRNTHKPRKDRPQSYTARKSGGVKKPIPARGFDTAFKRTIPSKNKPSRTVRRET